MNNHVENALNLKHSGMNCCQAVLAAFEDKTGLDRQKNLALGAGFGLGMGNMMGTCGAVVGAVLAMEHILPDSKEYRTYAARIIKNFKNECGAVNCEDLKGVKTGKVLAPCDKCVEAATRILDEILE